jgi:hypothetical protein
LRACDVQAHVGIIGHAVREKRSIDDRRAIGRIGNYWEWLLLTRIDEVKLMCLVQVVVVVVVRSEREMDAL